MIRLTQAILAVVLILALLVVGVIAGRAWFPRVQYVQVAKEILKVVTVPGKTEIVKFEVPGATVLVESTRFVDRPGRERIVTVTKPVPVPVEVIKTEWPQVITVAVGAVLTKEHGWGTPVNPQLVIGQVAPGAYAVSSQMEGWKIETVTTETKITPLPAPARFNLQIRPALGVVYVGSTFAPYLGVRAEGSLGHHVLSGLAGMGLKGQVYQLEYSFRF